MDTAKQRRGLRTKTGCMTCRSRRKKCDEKFPVCSLCGASNRSCQWPTTADILDRRHSSHPQSRHAPHSPNETTTSSSSSDGEGMEVVRAEWPHAVTLKICLQSETTAHRNLQHGLELAISRHFIEKYYGLLVLPNCHTDFYNGWITEIQYLMMEHKSLFYAVLANGASHLHFVDSSHQMQELALTYYSNALRHLSTLLASSPDVENHNGLLMSIMLLYLHGCMGRGTYTDIPRHLSAATRAITTRLSRENSVTRPFDRLAIESVLYQVFLVATGLWSEEIPLDYNFDQANWLEAERLLDKCTMFPGGSNSLNSPVLGVPVALYRLAVFFKDAYQAQGGADDTAVEKLRSELKPWEQGMLDEQGLDCLRLSEEEQPNAKHIFYRDSTHLFILCLSMLLDQMSGVPLDSAPCPAPINCWQLARAIAILQSHAGDQEWYLCYLLTWPVYTLGFFVSTQEHIELLRSDIHARWRLQKFAQPARFANDLEIAWRKRGFSNRIHRRISWSSEAEEDPP